MAKKIILSIFMILVVLTASFYILLPDKVKIDVGKTNTKYSVWEDDSWVLAATEYVNLYDGTTKMRAKSRNLSNTIEGDLVKIIRTSKWKENITTVQTYVFDSSLGDIESFPLENIFECFNCEDKIVHYEIRDILYDGETKTISSPFSFRHNMKIEWEEDAYYSKVFQQKIASDKIIIKYRPQSNYEVYNVRLFDPEITTFNNSLTAENLTFTGDENITRYLEIISNANVSSAFLNLSGYTNEWNLSNAIYDSIFISVQGNPPTDLFFKPDGTKMYSSDSNNDNFYQYSCIDAWNISSCTYDNVNISGQDQTVSDLFFKPDGTKMYEIGTANNRIYQYTCSDAWNLSSCTYDSIFISGRDGFPTGMFFKPDGSELYVIGYNNDNFYQYSCSEVWNLSSCIYDNVNISTQNTFPQDLFFKPDGIKLYEVDSVTNLIYQYTCSDAWNLSSCTYDDINLSVQDGSSYGLFFKPDGTKMYELGGSGRKVYQYTVSDIITNPYLEIGIPDGTHEWNFTGGFDESFSPNKTNDFSSALNTALDSGLCTGGTLNGINCTIPFLFHSDTAGILGYSDLIINYTQNYLDFNISITSNTSFKFFPDNNTHQGLPAENQTDSIGVFNATNNLTGGIEIWAKLNETDSNITLKIGNSSNYSNSISINTTYQLIYYNLTVNESQYLWSWADYNNATHTWFPELEIKALFTFILNLLMKRW